MYEAIYRRRDVRRFLSRPVSDKLLRRILRAAHHAGSIGFMQPWNFIIIKELEIKHRVKEEFVRADQAGALASQDERQRQDQILTAEAIEQAPINLAVTCDRSRRGPHVPGRRTVLDPDLLVTCCAIQNLWLAARTEGVGVGWVNILDPSAMAGILGLPSGIVLVAYLCMGYVSRFTDTPALEMSGDESRLSLESVLFYDRWGNRAPGAERFTDRSLKEDESDASSRRSPRSSPRGAQEP